MGAEAGMGEKIQLPLHSGLHRDYHKDSPTHSSPQAPVRILELQHRGPGCRAPGYPQPSDLLFSEVFYGFKRVLWLWKNNPSQARCLDFCLQALLFRISGERSKLLVFFKGTPVVVPYNPAFNPPF